MEMVARGISAPYSAGREGGFSIRTTDVDDFLFA